VAAVHLVVLDVTDPPPPDQGRVVGVLNAAKGLTLANVLILALLAAIAVPIYVIYRALGDEKIMDRLMSTYEEIDDHTSGCAIRHVQERGGPDLWGVSSGFAFQGRDRWYVNVVLDHSPSEEEIASYCESLKLIGDKMLAGDDAPVVVEPGSDGEILGRPVPGAEADGRRHDRSVPAATEAEEAE
jgi:hypothetical protein